jgi:four helix bundle protein
VASSESTPAHEAGRVERLQSSKTTPAPFSSPSKYAIALKEARESRYWLRLLIESGDSPGELGWALVQEAEELKRIIASIIVKAKRNAAPE